MVAHRPSKTRKPVGPALTRDRIVDEALSIVDDGGLDALTMRRLADDLGVAPNAVYWHIRTRDELLRRVLDRALNEIDIPPDDGPWEGRLRAICRATRKTHLDHPHLSDLSRRFVSEVSGRVLQATIDILRAAGLERTAAVNSAVLFHTFTNGFSVAEAPDPRGDGRSGVAPTAESLAEWLKVAGADGPFLLADLLSVDHDAVFNRGLDHLIVGLQGELGTAGNGGRRKRAR